jgi:hypothetical protein
MLRALLSGKMDFDEIVPWISLRSNKASYELAKNRKVIKVVIKMDF